MKINSKLTLPVLFVRLPAKKRMLEEPMKGEGQKHIRELSDKELNEITRAFGDQVRAQSIDLKNGLKQDLSKELLLIRASYNKRSED